MPEARRTVSSSQRLCASADLRDAAEAVPFEVVYHGQICRAFAVRFEGQPLAYLNRCTHVPMELDFQPNRFFDATGQWLMCATHGATYSPQSGHCVAGPCRGGLVKIQVSQVGDEIRWHTSPYLQPPKRPHD